MSTSLKKPTWLVRGALALVGGAAFLAAVSTPARAMPGQPGSALYGYYDVGEPVGVGETGAGDNILHLINPAGNANRGFGVVTNKCAMIYVFDNDQEMGECCGCPLTPAQEETFSFNQDLLANWIGFKTGDGVVAIRAQDINNNGCSSFRTPGTTQAACNGGCDPTNGPPSSLNSNLLGSISRLQHIDIGPTTVTELTLFNNDAGDPGNNTYLITQCAALVGNGSGAGICHCPSTETPE